jgi:Sec-independent protein translocase protein TatA
MTAAADVVPTSGSRIGLDLRFRQLGQDLGSGIRNFKKAPARDDAVKLNKETKA